MGCETVVPSSFSLSIALPQLEMLILRHFYTVIPPLLPEKHRATPPRKDPILFLLFLAPFFLSCVELVLPLREDRSVLYTIPAPPYLRDRKVSVGIKRYSKLIPTKKFFFSPLFCPLLFSLSVSLGVHMHRQWFQSRAVPLLRDR